MDCIDDDELTTNNDIVYFYKIVSKDNTYRYVGKTINFHKRLANHIQASYKDKNKLKLYKTIRDNNYWWNFEMILIDTKYNITDIQVQDTEQYYIDYYECNLNTNRAKRDINRMKQYCQEKYKLYKQLNNPTTRSIILIKDIINYNDDSSYNVKLYYDLLKYLQIDLKRDYDKNILKHYVIDNSKKHKFLTGFKNDILNDDFINFINKNLLLEYNNNFKIYNHKKIEIDVLNKNNIKQIKTLISHYLKHLNLYIDYGSQVKNQSCLLDTLQFTIKRYNKNIMLNYPNKKVKNINCLQQEQVIIYKDIDDIETINNNIILKPLDNIKKAYNKYYDVNIRLNSELYMSYNNNERIKKRRYYTKYYDDITRQKIINFINIQIKKKPLNVYKKTDYHNQYYNDIKDSQFSKMNNVFIELLKNNDDLIIINN